MMQAAYVVSVRLSRYVCVNCCIPHLELACLLVEAVESLVRSLVMDEREREHNVTTGALAALIARYHHHRSSAVTSEPRVQRGLSGKQTSQT